MKKRNRIIGYIFLSSLLGSFLLSCDHNTNSSSESSSEESSESSSISNSSSSDQTVYYSINLYSNIKEGIITSLRFIQGSSIQSFDQIKDEFDAACKDVNKRYAIKGVYRDSNYSSLLEFPYTISNDSSIYIKVEEIPENSSVLSIIYSSEEIANKYLSIENGNYIHSVDDIDISLSTKLGYKYEIVGMYIDEAFNNLISFDNAFLVEKDTSIYIKVIEKSKELVIDNSIEINDSEYLNNTWITSVVINDKVEKIGNKAFKGCKNLSKVTLSNNLSYIGTNVFDDCPIEFNSFNGANYIGSSNNDYYLLYSLSTAISGYSYSIASDNRMIYHEALKNQLSVEAITLSDKTIFIGNGAFSNCRSLEGVNMPNTVTYVGYKAFMNCNSLKNLTISNRLEKIDESVFAYCDSLERVVIPSSVKTIGECAFYACTELIELEISNGVKSIEDEAFFGCEILESVLLPKSLSSFGKRVFGGCKNLKTIDIDDGNETFDDGNSNCVIDIEKNMVIAGCVGSAIPDGISIVGEYAFSDIFYITSIKIPNTVVEIQRHAFSGCSNLSIVSLSSNLLSIGSYAFSECVSLSSISSSSKLKTIESYAFYKCTSLSEFVLNEGLETIGSSAFNGCSSLTYLNTPLSLKLIEEGAFQNTGLVYYVLLDNDLIIEKHALADGSAIFTLKESLDEELKNYLLEKGITIFYKGEWELGEDGKPVFNHE